MSKLLSLLLFVSIGLSAQVQNDWYLFEKAEFKEVFVKEFYSFKSLLIQSEEISALEGRVLNITGYYIPVATKDNSIILSKTPFASCFFCGSAGQETVIDVRLNKAPKRNYVADDKISVSGVLKLNFTDWETLSFILEDAKITKEH